MGNGRRVVAGLLLIGLAGCGRSSSSPAEPRQGSLALAKATVSVDGVVLNGSSIAIGHRGGATHFEAELRDAMGQRLGGETVQVAYSIPGGMMGGMMQGRMILYDDGTHGDHMAGDGVYCSDDATGQYGCHGDNATMGEHRYDFFGMDHQGRESNHMMVVVNVTGN